MSCLTNVQTVIRKGPHLRSKDTTASLSEETEIKYLLMLAVKMLIRDHWWNLGCSCRVLPVHDRTESVEGLGGMNECAFRIWCTMGCTVDDLKQGARLWWMRCELLL